MTTQVTNTEKLCNDLLETFGKLFGVHPGFRPVHAKGTLCSGTFVPSKQASELTRAPYAAGPEVKVVVRFSNSTGVPLIPDNDANANPRGVGVRFYLGEHVHSDIIGHTHNGFPTRTGEEFLEMIQAIAASPPDAPKPSAIEQFMASHPAALHFAQTPNPTPASYATETFFAVIAFEFINKDGVRKFGRFQIHPEGGNKHLSDEDASAKGPDYLSEELKERLAKGPAKFRIEVEIAKEGDDVADATKTWPADRKHIEFGTLTLTGLVPTDDPEASRIIFDPIPRVDGIEPSQDPLIELRSALYLISGRRRRSEAAKH
jgi:catalase